MGTASENFTYDNTMSLSPKNITPSLSHDYESQEVFKRLKDAQDHNISLLNRHSEMVNSGRDINSLHHAEAVIESQHIEILKLTNDVEQLNSKINDMSSNNDQSQSKLLQDIGKLNDHIVKLESDLQLTVEKSQTYLNTIKSLEAKLVHMNNLILSKDTDANQSYQLNHKLRIRNSELETKYQELLTDLYQVKEERDRFASAQTNAKEYVNTADISCRLRKREDIKDLALHMYQMDDVKKKCIIQLESELLTYKNTCQRQCEEIKQLNDTLERTKLGGNNFNSSNKMVQCLQKQILHLSNDIHTQTRLVQEYQMSMANRQMHQPKQNTNFNTALDIINETQKFELDRAMVMKFLSKIEDAAVKNTVNKSRLQILNPYYSCYVYLNMCHLEGYCTYDDTHNGDLDYNVNLCVCLDKLCIFNEGNTETLWDKSGYFELPVTSIESVTTNDNTFKIVTKKNTPWVHLHIVAKNHDEFNRLYFSLCYNGAISNIVLNGCNVFGGVAQSCEVNLPIILYTKMQEVMGSIFYNSDFNILMIVPTDNKILPFIIKCDEYMLTNVDNVDDAEFTYYSMYNKCDIGHLFALQRYQLDDVETLETNFISTTTDEYYYLTCLNEADIIQLDRILDYAEWHDIEPETGANDDVTDVTDDDAHDDQDEEFVSSITPFEIRDGFIYLKFVDISDASQGIDAKNCVFIADADKNELAILVTGEPNENEMFIFSLPTNKDFEYWKKYLLDNDIEQQERELNKYDDAKLYRSSSGKFGQQACVVTKGQMQLYKNYTDDTSEPLITYLSTSTKVTINEVKREIIMESMSTQGNKSRITLDCTNPKEFVRWKSALLLAGFISDSSVKDIETTLKKYVFPIKLFKSSEANESTRRAFVIKSNYVALYISSSSKEPYLLFRKSDIEVLIFANDRRIRLYVRRYTKNEERFDFVLPLMKDFSTACAEFKSFCYKVSSGEDVANIAGDKSKVMKNSKHPFVLAKPGSVTLHLTMYTPDAEVTVKPSDYTCNIVKNKLKIEFIPKNDNVKKLPPLVFKQDNYFNKWLLTLKVSGFLRFTSERMSKLYFPTIFYGHISPESIMLSSK